MSIVNRLPCRALVDALEGRRLFATPTEWVSDIDNPYMPLAPGMTWTYRGVTDGDTVKDRTSSSRARSGSRA